MTTEAATPLNEQETAARGRELSEAEWHLPKKYRLQAALLELEPQELKRRDPEMYALWEHVKADEKRLAAAAAMPFGQMSSQDMFRARAAQRAEEHRVAIYHLDQQIGQALTTGEGNVEELQAAKLAVRHKRAEQLAILGRFDLAASEEPDPQFRDHYLAILDAVWLDDDMRCDCPADIRGSGEHSQITVPSFNASEEVYSIKHARVITVMKCSRCGFLNAVDAPKRVLQQRAHRARAAQLVSNLSPEDAAKVLTAKGLTSAKLLGAK